MASAAADAPPELHASSSDASTQLAEARQQIESLQHQLAGKQLPMTRNSSAQAELPAALSQAQLLQLADSPTSSEQAQDSKLATELTQARAECQRLGQELEAVKAARAAEVGSARVSRETAERLRDQAGAGGSRSASPGREQGEIWRQLNSLQQQLRDVQVCHSVFTCSTFCV